MSSGWRLRGWGGSCGGRGRVALDHLDRRPGAATTAAALDGAVWNWRRPVDRINRSTGAMVSSSSRNSPQR